MEVKWYQHLFKVLSFFFLIPLFYCDEVCYKLFGDRKLDKEDEEDVSGEVVVITGANRGIGKQIAIEFAQRGAKIVLACRNVKSGLQAAEEIREQTKNENLDVIQIDLMDMNSVEHFASVVTKKYPKIKILLNNAGVAGADCGDPDKLTKDGFNPVMAANHLGHFLLTNLLLKSLRNATKPRVIVLTSVMQKVSLLALDDLTMQESGFGFMNALPYVNSKHANSLFAMDLARRMAKEGSDMNVYSVCPGLVYTGLISQSNRFVTLSFKLFCKIAGMECKEAVSEFIMDVAISKKIGRQESGLMYQFRKPCGRINPKLNKETEFAEKLWDVSANLVKLDERLYKA